MLYARDCRWWTLHAQTALKFAGIKVSSDAEVPFKAVHNLRESGKHGFDPDPSCIKHGGNSGYQALHVAAHAGATKILLLGFDLHGTHFFGVHPYPLRNTNAQGFSDMVASFDTIAPELERRKIEVINCSPDSALTCFRKADLRDCL